jgi:hypothetical protein
LAVDHDHPIPIGGRPSLSELGWFKPRIELGFFWKSPRTPDSAWNTENYNLSRRRRSSITQEISAEIEFDQLGTRWHGKQIANTRR